MTKLIVETTGDFELVDFPEDQIIYSDRPTIVTSTTFVSARTALGQLKVLDTVSDEATDAEFLSYLKESNGDLALALSAFKSAYDVDSKDSKPAPATGRGRKPKEE